MAKTIQGWTSNNIPGWAAEMELVEEEDGTFLVCLSQTFRAMDRGTAEIMGASMRLEGAGREGAQWDTWDPIKLRFMNNARYGK